MAIVDIVIIAFLGLFALVGFSKGFIKTILKMFGGLASLAIAVVTAKPVATLLNKLWDFTGFFAGKVGSAIALPTEITSLFSGEGVTSAAIKEALNTAGGFWNKAIAVLVPAEQVYTTSEIFLTQITNIIGTIIMLVLTALILWLLISIAVKLLSKLFDSIGKGKAINGADRILGLILGAAKGALIVVGAMVLVYFLSGIPLISDNVGPIIQNSVVVKWGYGYVEQFLTNSLATYDFNALFVQIFGGGA